MRQGRKISVKGLAAGAIAAGVLAAGASAQAQTPPAPAPPPPYKVRVGAHTFPKPFGLTYVYGYVRRQKDIPREQVANRQVALEQSYWPFTQWAPVGFGSTDFLGYFSFRFTRVDRNTMYRATVLIDGQPWLSQNLLLHRPYRPSLSLSARKHKRHGRRTALVTARGNVRPAAPGVHGWIQSSTDGGRWRNVKRVALRGAGSVSTFRSRPIRITRTTSFRLSLPDGTQNSRAISNERSVHLP
jgi:hypothetical protein